MTSFWRFIPASAILGHHHGQHNPWLLVVSAIVAMVAAFTALAVVDRIVAAGGPRMRRVWLALGAVAMGLGIWAMHFTAMLAFHLPVPVSYDPWITFLSLIPAVLGSAVAIRVLSGPTASLPSAPGSGRSQRALGGIPLVLGIGGMHFTGMEAMQMNASLRYQPVVFVLSLVVCYVLAWLALEVVPLAYALLGAKRLGRIFGAALMGLSVTFMHHTAMWAAVFLPIPGADPVLPGIHSGLLAVLVALGATVVVGLTLVATFVDERLTRIAASLYASETRHRTVLESMSDAVLTFDAAGRIESANHAAATCFGCPASELVGMEFDRLVPGVMTMTGAGHAASAGRRIAAVGRRHDGTEFPAELTLSEMTIDRERLTSAVVRDATEQRRQQDAIHEHIHTLEKMSASLRERSHELAQERDRAEAATRAKSDFLATMSHEIRTPMNGILATTELLLEGPINDEQDEQLRIIRGSGEALLHVINDILDFSKVEAGRLTLDRIGFDAVDVVDAVRILLAPTSEQKRLDFAVRIVQAPPRLVGDPLRLRQVVLNLASNALKFTEQGGVTIEVDGSPQGSHWRLRITVRDTGIGIDRQTASRLFTAFSQADASTTRRYGGTGLGLAICKRLVELMEGTIGVESQPGVGSAFSIDLSLPLHEGAGSGTASEREDAPRLEDTAPLRVLVAEDNPINQRVATFLLARLGCEIHIASDGAQAVAAWKAGTFDLILMDCQMPGMDGYEAAQAIRAAEGDGRPRVPIVAVTANAMEGDRDQCMAAGMDDYVTKPLTKGALGAAINRLIDRGALRPRPIMAA